MEACNILSICSKHSNCGTQYAIEPRLRGSIWLCTVQGIHAIRRSTVFKCYVGQVGIQKGGEQIHSFHSDHWPHWIIISSHQNAITEDPAAHGAMLVPIIAGADKTTVLVATGQNEFHPLYMSIRNVYNSICRAHKDTVIPIAFLAISKGARLSMLAQCQTNCDFLSLSRRRRHCGVPHIPQASLSHINCTHLCSTSRWDDRAWNRLLSWQALSAGNLRAWTIHSWLFQTGCACWNRARMVPKVSLIVLVWYI